MDHPFDIEQDNNPSLYGNSFQDDQYFNKSLSVSSTLHKLLASSTLQIEIAQTEKLINSNIIVYLIKVFDSETTDHIIVKRRYSEFKSFRDNLLKLYPTKLIPPIPEKHSLLSYVLNSINANNEVELIGFRKRFFNQFMIDLIAVRFLNSSPFLQKFLDPNYELCWNNALNESPISNLPKSLLLSNPLDPTDQNGLYLLLPKINSFHNNNLSELYKLNLDPLSHMNDSLLRLSNQINFAKFPVNEFVTIPTNIINFETYILHNLKILKNLHKYNAGHIKNFKLLLSIMINLGGNLNNFSLEIYELNTHLSNLIEKFGSIIDLNFLNFENFLFENFIPHWHETITQLYQYFNIALNLLNFYKYKILQFKILFNTKFAIFNQLTNLNTSLSVNDLNHLNELNSPSINNLVKSYQSRGSLRTKKSWFRVFGGSNATAASSLPSPALSAKANNSSSTPSTPDNPDARIKIEYLERELNKLDQLIDLMNHDLVSLTKEIDHNLGEFAKLIEKKWLEVFLNFIQSTKQLFIENLSNWQEFKDAFEC
ncbi:Sorting nexin-41 [Yamadazyma tenuis]|uniref:PX domain-containing protein n=1 Tax=Candida tenuis (strain ATCC 10573 / BCRC 21748 / CBS 615 / JCM 9827 / NBRC 10315 / NRRL Y-1498 / VKM Y-70) TaxID=590646 RepID=G3AYH4_CANTC|nr:uncharacterized protein CANTEDRAFT_101415 [Yamadazyma tenuis ATCC 10573]EGV65852.1 hypothetical protein CANTEDRAFT_101415 [Yamadazyma tenuis ATCC 10573]WEJ95818.1 Sorting nexin-41 [Yamadazyma tenuis]